MIKLDHVTKTYAVRKGNPVTAVNEVCFEIAQGEFLWKDVPFRTKEPIRASFGAEGLDIESVYLAMGEGGNDELFVAGHVGTGTRPALALHLQAQAGAAALAPWLPGLDLGGSSLVAEERAPVSSRP